MNAPSQHFLLLFSTGLIVVVRVYYLIRRLWNNPLEHGSDYFLGIQVAPGFYSGAGVQWMRRYRTVVSIEHLIEAGVLAAILISGYWELLPAWAGGSAVLFLAVLFGFRSWARRTLGASPPIRSSIALTLESRRLGDYISWPLEALMAVIIGVSWYLLLIHGDGQFDWLNPLALTYVVVGMLPCKIFIVRSHIPLPAERTEEHQHWFDASRRYALRVLDSMRWLFLAALAGQAGAHGWPEVKAVAGLRWFYIGVILAIWSYLCYVLIRSGGRVVAMGRNLQPAGSWSGPFGGTKIMSPAGWIWTIAFYGGLVLLIFFPR